MSKLMTIDEIFEEFDKLHCEIFKKRPKISPIPPDVIKRRELLIWARNSLVQVYNYKKGFNEDKKNKRIQKCYTDMYRIFMKHYYNWNKK